LTKLSTFTLQLLFADQSCNSTLTLVHALVITRLDHCNSVLAGTAGYLQNRLQTAVCAERRRSACLLSPGVGAHNLTAPLTFTGYAYRSESSLGCVFRHIIAYTAQHRRIWQTACGRQQNVVARRRLRSADRHNDAAGAADSAGNLRRPRVSGGCGASMEQSATTD